MSRIALLCIDIFLAIVTSGISNDFTCINNECTCLNGECSHTCSPHQCTNMYFLCPSSAALCLVNCNGRESCKHTTLFGAAANVVLNCNGTDSCTATRVSCGIQNSFPIVLSSSSAAAITTNQFTGSMSDCFVNLLTPNAMRFANISCVGSIANCVVDAYAAHSISDSSFQCNTDRTDGSGCQLNCLQPTSCSSVEYVCNAPFGVCSCGVLDPNCGNAAITLRRDTYPRAHDTSTDEYNCMDLGTTEVEIRSMARPGRDSTFHYEISGKDAHHDTILFRYKYASSLSAASHPVHRSVHFSEHEEYGNTYDFEWIFNEPKVICWRTEELSAVMVDLFYNADIRFAFTYIYSEDMVRKPSGQWMLTAKNNWNLGVTYLENGFLSFDYEYNITLLYPLTMEPTVEHTASPTPEPTDESVVRVGPEQTTTNDSPHNGNFDGEGTTMESPETTVDLSQREREVIESTANRDDASLDSRETVKVSAGHNTDTPIKGLLFGIALAALCSICCIIGCIVYNKKKQTQRMAAAYASADAVDSEEEDLHTIRAGNQGDIDEDDNDTDDMVHPMQNDSMDIAIVDADDVMDDAEYNRLRRSAMQHNNAGADARTSQSQTSLIKKYKTLDPRKVLPSVNRAQPARREVSVSKSVSESGIGYIARSKMIGNGSEDDQGMSDDESLLARDRDISMDAEYHHVVTRTREDAMEISLMEDEEQVMSRLHHVKRESVSVSQTEETLDDTLIAAGGNGHISHTTLGFEAGDILEHYVNQDSTFQTMRNNMKKEKEAEMDEKREVSVSQSMSRLSQSLSIPPIQLHHDITDVKTLKSKTSIQSATDSMKKFSEKIANCAAKFGHDASRTTTKKQSKKKMEDDRENDADHEDEDQFATIVIYKNENASNIPESQIVQSTTPPPIPMLNAVDVFMEPESTQTMIVKHNTDTSDAQLSQIQSSHDALLTDDSCDSSDDISNSPKDPIDASEDDAVISERKRHRTNVSSVSNKSYHDRRTMIISDDLNIEHLMDDDDDEEDSD